MCGLQTRAYWRVFANLAYRIDEEDPLTSLKVALRRQRETYRFPKDDEFARDLESRDLYGMRNCHYMLDRFENHGSKEPYDTSDYTIEHIMPQNENLSKAWRDMLGPDYQRVQGTWLHRLGNLTLTGYNTTYSDRPFEQKKTVEGGFNDSSIRLNKWVRERSQWTEDEIAARGGILAKKAVGIWPGLVVDEMAVKNAELAELKERASRRDVSQVHMSSKAQELFDVLRPKVLALGPEIVEMAEPKSVSYHAMDFFLEILPRKYKLTLLLELEFSECELDSGARDAREYKFFQNAMHSAGVYYNLHEEADRHGAVRLIRKAYQLASA